MVSGVSCVSVLCVAQLAPACGPRCETPPPDFLIGRALVSAEESRSHFFERAFCPQGSAGSGVSRGLLACSFMVAVLCALRVRRLKLLTTTQLVTPSDERAPRRLLTPSNLAVINGIAGIGLYR